MISPLNKVDKLFIRNMAQRLMWALIAKLEIVIDRSSQAADRTLVCL